MESIMCLIEDAGSNYAAFFPYLHGIAITGATIEEVKKRATESLIWYKRGIIEDNLEMPDELKGEYEITFYKLLKV